MDKIFDGAMRFMSEGFSEHEELFSALEKEQNPHTLFIGCSDSRLIPSLITQTLPGELFVVRNIANIIPPYRIKDEFLASTAAIEYALNKLEVDNIIICGHSNCGGCKDLDSKSAKELPNLKNWLKQLDDVKCNVDRILELSHCEGDAGLRSWMIERANVIHSYQNLLTYPHVKEKLAENKLKIRAWYYLIPTGEIYEYCEKNGHFISLKEKE